jgi:branched-chain amino acid transport system permease protein
MARKLLVHAINQAHQRHLHRKEPMDIFIQQLINGLVLGSMYALVALGYTMVYGIINLINFAHGEILMVGALTSWTVVTVLAASGLPGWALMVIALCLASLVCAALNYSVEKIAYRPLRDAPRLAPLITAMGMSLLLQTLAMVIWKPNPKPFPQLLPSEPHHLWSQGPVISTTQIVILALTAVMLAGLMYLVNYTKLGRAMRATAENPRVASLMGVKPDRVISATFIIGAVLAAVAGLMWAANYGTAQHTMGFMPGLKAFTAAVLGGIGNLAGAVVGGILLGLIEAIGAGYLGELTGGVLGSHYADIFAFVALILVLTLRPSGLLGERVADRA